MGAAAFMTATFVALVSDFIDIWARYVMQDIPAYALIDSHLGGSQ